MVERVFSNPVLWYALSPLGITRMDSWWLHRDFSGLQFRKRKEHARSVSEFEMRKGLVTGDGRYGSVEG